MKLTPTPTQHSGQPLPRNTYLQILNAALRTPLEGLRSSKPSGKVLPQQSAQKDDPGAQAVTPIGTSARSPLRFAKEVAISWLTAYPGDLQVGLLYGRSLLNEGYLRQALPVLEGLCLADPEFVEAYQELAQAQRLSGLPALSITLGCLQALGANLEEQDDRFTSGQAASVAWGLPLRLARLALARGDLRQAEKRIVQVLGENPPTPLAAVVHLDTLEAQGEAPLAARRDLAEYYHRTWPDCIQCTMRLADWLMRFGDADRAVELLHQAAARDVAGQVASRIWGDENPYRSLWPEHLELPLEIAIPASVSSKLGWNRLDSGSPAEVLEIDPAGLEAVDKAAKPLQPPDLSCTPDSQPPAARIFIPLEPLVVDTAPEEPLPQISSNPVSRANTPSNPEATITGDPFRMNLVEPDSFVDSERAIEMPADMTAPVQNTEPVEKVVVAKNAAFQFSLSPLRKLLKAIRESAEELAREVQGQSGSVLKNTSDVTNGQPEVSDRSEYKPSTGLLPEVLIPIREELERVASRSHQSGLTRSDGRFPVYVVFSTHRGLEDQYGDRGAAAVEVEMNRLVEAVNTRSGWAARLFLADDPSCTVNLGIRLARPADPWDLKLALMDLDVALGKQGEMIGAVLIVGGHEVVPFHRLPNPVDDLDSDILSDNPYATRDENYFIPEWVVGRMPGGSGKDAGLLLAQLRAAVERHSRQGKSKTLPAQITGRSNWIEKLLSWVKPAINGRPSSLGLTAAIWRLASQAVYRPIGNPRSMLISPPLVMNGRPYTLPVARLGYFNLHGLADAPEWFGQRDPSSGVEGPDYPVALRPADISLPGSGARQSVPDVVFSEACYGTYVQGKSPEASVALKFLLSGVQAVAGSTCMAYGSINSDPLIAADLLGVSFWNNVRQGQPAGEALRRAKIQLAQEMQHRQGYLDGEDQKTLISFILYGDPLAQPFGSISRTKGVWRSLRPPSIVKTVCDRSTEPATAQSIPPEVMVNIKSLVSQYLPGMAGAQVTMTEERASCSGIGHECPTGQLCGKARPPQAPQRRLITLSKQVEKAELVHPQYARLTLDAQNHLVKLAVSR